MIAKNSISLQKILAIEDDTAITEFKCSTTGLPLWPQIRIVYIRMIMADHLYDAQLTGRSDTKASAWQAATTLLRSMAHNRSSLGPSQLRSNVLITSEGVADFMDAEGNWFNRLTDHFANIFPQQTHSLADHFEWRWPFPRSNERIIFHAPAQAWHTVLGRLYNSKDLRLQAARLVGHVNQRSQEILGWTPGGQRTAHLVQMLARKAAALPIQIRTYRRLLEAVAPRVLLVGCGCYGQSSALIATAKELGICTAEYQHGAVSAGHDGYNFAPALLEDEDYRKTLPDYFLSYGSWWTDQINAPIKPVAIGNPHREAKIASIRDRRADTRDLLILSDGIEFELYLELALKIAPLARKLGLRIRLRPHPLERTRISAEYLGKIDCIDIDMNTDIYASLETAHTVISELSTGTFEAINLVERIFIWNTEKARFAFPISPFETFDTPEKLIYLLQDPSNGKIPESLISSVWERGWVAKYKAFLHQQGVS
jgi:hypothetical protein